MKLKKLLALLLAMMMAFALVACGDTADTGDDAADDQQVQDDAAADDTQTSPEGQSLLTILADQFIPAPDAHVTLRSSNKRQGQMLHAIPYSPRIDSKKTGNNS